MPTCEEMVERWTKNRPKFAKRMLIDRNGCCCAGGDVLLMCGVTTDGLKEMSQVLADKTISEALKISVFHAILLRVVNDSLNGCPENVLQFTDEGLGKVLGHNWRSMIALGEHWSAMDRDAWRNAMKIAGSIEDFTLIGTEAMSASLGVAGELVTHAAAIAARSAVYVEVLDYFISNDRRLSTEEVGANAALSTEEVGANAALSTEEVGANAAYEMLGHSGLKKPFQYSAMFGIADVPAFIAEAEKRWR